MFCDESHSTQECCAKNTLRANCPPLPLRARHAVIWISPSCDFPLRLPSCLLLHLSLRRPALASAPSLRSPVPAPSPCCVNEMCEFCFSFHSLRLQKTSTEVVTGVNPPHSACPKCRDQESHQASKNHLLCHEFTKTPFALPICAYWFHKQPCMISKNRQETRIDNLGPASASAQAD